MAVKVRDVFIESHEFFMSRLHDNAILGLSFVEHFNCHILFGRAILQLDEHELICTDSRATHWSARFSLFISKLSAELQTTTGMMESCGQKHQQLTLAASLYWPDSQRRGVVRGVSVAEEPLVVQAGTVLKYCQAVYEDSVVTAEPTATFATIQSGTGSRTGVPDHVKPLYDNAVSLGLTTNQQLKLRNLLCEYADVFSSGERDVALTSLIKHSILVLPGITSIR